MQTDPAGKFFSKSVTERDRAVFECGITLGAIYHQFQGTPLTNDEITIRQLEQAIECTMKNQPCIENIKIKIEPSGLKDGQKIYDYSELTGKHLRAEVITRYGTSRVLGKLNYIEELDFPLMYIDDLE